MSPINVENIVIQDPKKIYIDTESLKEKIKELETTKNTINNAYEDFKNNTSHFSNSWSGDTGDMINSELTKYVSSFERKINDLNEKIGFLKAVVTSYEGFDKYVYELLNHK